jgi:hypothetical protein
MNQPPTPDPSLDSVLNALRSAATAEELSGEAAAISAMASAITDSPEGLSSMNPNGRTPLTRPTFSRARRIVGLTAIGVLGVAGVAAAGAGVFVPDNRPKVETVPGTDHSDDTAVETTMVDDESAGSTVPDDTTADSTTDTDAEAEKQKNEGAVDTTPAGGTTAPAATDTTIVCADGNHGMTVSSVAHATPPGPGHGAAVSAAAQSDCGKGTTTDSTVVATHDTTSTTLPKDKGNKPADPGSQGNGGNNGNGGGNGNGNGGGNGNGKQPSDPATVWKGKGG